MSQMQTQGDPFSNMINIVRASQAQQSSPTNDPFRQMIENYRISTLPKREPTEYELEGMPVISLPSQRPIAPKRPRDEFLTAQQERRIDPQIAARMSSAALISPTDSAEQPLTVKVTPTGQGAESQNILSSTAAALGRGGKMAYLETAAAVGFFTRGDMTQEEANDYALAQATRRSGMRSLGEAQVSQAIAEDRLGSMAVRSPGRFVQGMAGTVAESVGQTAGTMIGGAVVGAGLGAAGAGPVGAGAGSIATMAGGAVVADVGSRLAEELESRGVDVTDGGAVYTALKGEIGNQIRNKVRAASSTVGVIEAVGTKVAGKASTIVSKVAQPGVVGKTLEKTAEGVVGGVFGSTGEIAAQTIQGKDINWSEVAAEGIGELVQTPIEVGVVALSSKKAPVSTPATAPDPSAAALPGATEAADLASTLLGEEVVAPTPAPAEAEVVPPTPTEAKVVPPTPAEVAAAPETAPAPIAEETSTATPLTDSTAFGGYAEQQPEIQPSRPKITSTQKQQFSPVAIKGRTLTPEQSQRLAQPDLPAPIAIRGRELTSAQQQELAQRGREPVVMEPRPAPAPTPAPVQEVVEPTPEPTPQPPAEQEVEAQAPVVEEVQQPKQQPSSEPRTQVASRRGRGGAVDVFVQRAEANSDNFIEQGQHGVMRVAPAQGGFSVTDQNDEGRQIVQTFKDKADAVRFAKQAMQSRALQNVRGKLNAAQIKVIAENPENAFDLGIINESERDQLIADREERQQRQQTPEVDVDAARTIIASQTELPESYFYPSEKQMASMTRTQLLNVARRFDITPSGKGEPSAIKLRKQLAAEFTARREAAKTKATSIVELANAGVISNDEAMTRLREATAKLGGSLKKLDVAKQQIQKPTPPGEKAEPQAQEPTNEGQEKGRQEEVLSKAEKPTPPPGGAVSPVATPTQEKIGEQPKRRRTKKAAATVEEEQTAAQQTEQQAAEAVRQIENKIVIDENMWILPEPTADQAKIDKIVAEAKKIGRKKSYPKASVPGLPSIQWKFGSPLLDVNKAEDKDIMKVLKKSLEPSAGTNDSDPFGLVTEIDDRRVLIVYNNTAALITAASDQLARGYYEDINDIDNKAKAQKESDASAVRAKTQLMLMTTKIDKNKIDTQTLLDRIKLAGSVAVKDEDDIVVLLVKNKDKSIGVSAILENDDSAIINVQTGYKPLALLSATRLVDGLTAMLRLGNSEVSLTTDEYDKIIRVHGDNADFFLAQSRQADEYQKKMLETEPLAKELATRLEKFAEKRISNTKKIMRGETLGANAFFEVTYDVSVAIASRALAAGLRTSSGQQLVAFIQSQLQSLKAANEKFNGVLITDVARYVRRMMAEAGDTPDKIMSFVEALDQNAALKNRIINSELPPLAPDMTDEEVRAYTSRHKRPDSMATMFSGGGMVEAGLADVATATLAVEADDAIAAEYAENFGDHVLVDRVENVDPRLAQGVKYLHASPVCKNFSNLKRVGGGEQQLDIDSAKAIADFIRKSQPASFTLENVPGYANSKAAQIVRDALTEVGYNFDEAVYNAADYGGATNRNRFIIRAVRSGTLPKVASTKPASDWFARVEGMIDGMADATLPPFVKQGLANRGIDYRKIDRPIIVAGSYSNIKSYPFAFAGGPAITVVSTPKAFMRIIMPDGRVKRVSARAMAAIMGLPTNFPLPASESVAQTIVGNGIPVELTKAVLAPVAQAGQRISNEAGASFADRLDNFADARFENTRKIMRGEILGANAFFQVAYDLGVGIAAKALAAGLRSNVRAELNKFIDQQIEAYRQRFPNVELPSITMLKKVIRQIMKVSNNDPNQIIATYAAMRQAAADQGIKLAEKELGSVNKLNAEVRKLMEKKLKMAEQLAKAVKNAFSIGQRAGLSEATRALKPLIENLRQQVRSEQAMKNIEKRSAEENNRLADRLEQKLQQAIDQRRLTDKPLIDQMRKQILDLRRIATLERNAAEKAEAMAAALEQQLANEAKARELVVNYINNTLPVALRGRYIDAAAKATTLSDVSKVLGRLRKDLAKYTFKVYRAKLATVVRNKKFRMRLTEPRRAAVETAMRNMESAWKIIRTKNTATSTLEQLAKDAKKIYDDAKAEIDAQKSEDDVRIGNRVLNMASIRTEMFDALSRLKALPLSENVGEAMISGRDKNWFKRWIQKYATMSTLMMGLDQDYWGKGVFMRLFNIMSDALSAEKGKIQEFTEKCDAIVRKYGYKNLADFSAKASGTLGEKQQQFVSVNIGGFSRIPLGVAMDIFIRDAETKAKFLKDNPVTFTAQGAAESFVITQDILDEIDNALTTEQKAIAFEINNLRNDMQFVRMNAVNKELTNQFLVEVPNHYPIRRKIDYSQENRDISDIAISDWVMQTMTTMGMLQARVENATSPIILGDFLNTELQTFRQAEQFVNRAPVVKLIKSTFYSETIQDQLMRRGGKQLFDRLRKTMSEYSGLERINDSWVRKLISNVSRAKTAVNLLTYLRNLGTMFMVPIARFSETESFGWKRMAIGAAAALKSPWETYQELKKYSPVLNARWSNAAHSIAMMSSSGTPTMAQSEFTQALKATVGNAIYAVQGFAKGDGLRRLNQLSMSINKLNDTIQMANIFDAWGAMVAYHGVMNDAPAGLSVDDKKKWAANKATKIFFESANTNDLLNATQWQLEARDNTLMAGILSFTSDIAKKQNLLLQTVKRGNVSGAVTAVSLATMWSMTIQQLATALFGTRGETEEDKETKRKALMIKTAMSETFSLLPGGVVGSDAISFFYDPKAQAYASNLLTTPINGVVLTAARSAVKLKDYLADRKEATAWDYIDQTSNILTSITDMYGLPISPVVNQAKQFYNNRLYREPYY